MIYVCIYIRVYIYTIYTYPIANITQKAVVDHLIITFPHVLIEMAVTLVIHLPETGPFPWDQQVGRAIFCRVPKTGVICFMRTSSQIWGIWGGGLKLEMIRLSKALAASLTKHHWGYRWEDSAIEEGYEPKIHRWERDPPGSQEVDNQSEPWF